MINDRVAELRELLPGSARVYSARCYVIIEYDDARLRLRGPDADALIRRLPPLPCRATIRILDDLRPTPRLKMRIRHALRWLKRPIVEAPCDPSFLGEMHETSQDMLRRARAAPCPCWCHSIHFKVRPGVEAP